MDGSEQCGKEKQTVHLIKGIEKKEYSENNEDFNKCYITFQSCCNVERCVERKETIFYMYYLVPSIAVCCSAYCTHTHTLANSFRRNESESRDVVFFISLLHTFRTIHH